MATPTREEEEAVGFVHETPWEVTTELDAE
jgi:hypothetical protein